METSSVVYNVSSAAITDKSLMSAKGQQLCADLDVYWMTPTCTDEQPSGTTALWTFILLSLLFGAQRQFVRLFGRAMQ